MSKIDIEVRVNQRVNISVDISEIIDGINELPIPKRWNHIAVILNGIDANLSDLNDDQREIIKTYLNKKLSLF
jgi:hypothetical protein